MAEETVFGVGEMLAMMGVGFLFAFAGLGLMRWKRAEYVGMVTVLVGLMSVIVAPWMVGK